MLHATADSVANVGLDHETEAATLRRLLGNRNQAEFARTFKIPGGPSMVSQHLSGHRPISLAAATAYVHAFSIPLEELSPRLARAVSDAAKSAPATPASPPTPAQPLTPTAVANALCDLIERLDDGARERVWGRLSTAARAPDSQDARAKLAAELQPLTPPTRLTPTPAPAPAPLSQKQHRTGTK